MTVRQPGGAIFVVATPIGNLADVGHRAVEVLGKVARVLCEDTRRTGVLMQHLGIQARMVSLHDHNERQRVEQVMAWLQAGEQLALVSDAGTPLISDPGFLVVAEARRQGFPVWVVPGACALVAALSVSGLAVERFYFEGFLPARAGARKEVLTHLLSMEVTAAFYESTHRILDTLADLADLAPERTVVLARELTKQYESVVTSTPVEHLERLALQPEASRGEFVVLIERLSQPAEGARALSFREIAAALSAEAISPTAAARILSKLLDLPRRDCYARLQGTQQPDDQDL